jgi:hypothetical protein
VLKQEKKLSLVFRHVDASHQGRMMKARKLINTERYILGKFDAEDLVFYFQKLGIKLELDEAKKLVEKYLNQTNLIKEILIEYLEWIKIIHCKFRSMNGVHFLWLIL